jgi:hypothetical protein
MKQAQADKGQAVAGFQGIKEVEEGKEDVEGRFLSTPSDFNDTKD